MQCQFLLLLAVTNDLQYFSMQSQYGPSHSHFESASCGSVMHDQRRLHCSASVAALAMALLK
jgi:hypothetical protein